MVSRPGDAFYAWPKKFVAMKNGTYRWIISLAIAAAKTMWADFVRTQLENILKGSYRQGTCLGHARWHESVHWLISLLWNVQARLSICSGLFIHENTTCDRILNTVFFFRPCYRCFVTIRYCKDWYICRSDRYASSWTENRQCRTETACGLT